MNNDKLEDSILSKLLSKSLDGDGQAYRQFLQQITPMLSSIAHKAFQKDDVPDVLQDIYLSIHKSLPSYDPKRPVRPWLFAIANRRVVDYIRKFETRKKTETLTHDGDVTIYPVDTKPEREEVPPFLQLVPYETQRAIILTKVEGYSTEEAAQIIGIKCNALRTRVSRGLTTIRKKFEEGHFDE